MARTVNPTRVLSEAGRQAWHGCFVSTGVLWLVLLAAPGAAVGQYHTYSEIGSELLAAETSYPTLCKRRDLGLSVQGRHIWALCITDNVGIEEDEPEFKYVSTMHGNEIMGVEMCMNLIDYLTANYGSVQRVTNIVDSVELWIVPLMNPDGFVAGQRRNANGIDLNRDFPDVYTSPNNTPDGRALETQVIMNWSFGHSFTLAANYHSGALVANYPFDGNASGSSVYTPTPDDDLFIWICEEYSQHNSPMWNSPVFDHGITNGADWYVIYGGMQDWNYRWMGCNEITVEVSNDYQPLASQIPTFWNENRESMLAYVEACLIGVRGLVTDASTNDPLAATVRVVGRDHDVYTDPDIGDYHRMLLAGKYDLSFEAEGYDPLTEEDVVVSSGDATRLDVSLWRTTVTYPNGGETLTAGTSTTITWTGSPAARFHVQYTDSADDIQTVFDGFETGILDPGSHELKWQYAKDGAVSDGSDSAWIDDLSLPADNTAWTDITAATPLGATSTLWTPLAEGSLYKVRVRSNLGGGTYGPWDESNSVFSVGPEVIPTVSQWGLVVLTLLMCTAGTIILARRRPQPAGAAGGRRGVADGTMARPERGTCSERYATERTSRRRGMTDTKLLLAVAGLLSWFGPYGLCGDGADIHTAAAAADLARMDALLRDAPGLVDARDAAGFSPLHLAVRNLRVEPAKRLLAAAADVNATDRHGATALHMALRAGRDTIRARTARESLVTLLLKHGADVKATDEHGKTPLHIAAITGRATLLDRLVEAGADPAAKDKLGRTPLHDAAMYNQLPVIEWLSSHKADIHAKDKQGNGPLHCAVLRYRKEAAAKLIELGASVNAKNHRGATPLHFTGTEGPEEPEVDRIMTEVAEMLIAHGADVNATDRSGKTPLQHAVTNKRDAVAALLRQHGATE